MSKAISQVKADIKPVESEEIKAAFDNLDIYQTGRIYIKDSLEALTCLGYDKSNNAIFKMLQELDTTENQTTGVTYEQFLNHFNTKINDLSPNGAQKIFNVFIDDEANETVSLTSLKRIFKEIGEPISDADIKEMIEKATSNGVNLTFREFFEYLSKQEK